LGDHTAKKVALTHYKTLPNENKEDLNNCTNMFYSWERALSTITKKILTKLICRLLAIPVKIFAGFLY
jgi:hypothetical protein